MILEDDYILNNGVKIPKLGLGTWFINNKNVVRAVVEATKAGYRHIDTAQVYNNESGIGEGICNAEISRQKLFVTTKLAAEAKTYKKAKSAIDKSLKKMKVDYIDMMLIHSPQPWIKFRGDNPFFEGNIEAWRAMEEAYKAGKLRAIGLSNFQERDLENIISNCSIAPMVNQVLAHIGNTPFELIEYSRKNGMLVEAYSPVAHGILLENQNVLNMAEKYNVSVPQLCIRYDIQLGLLPLPKTANPIHMKNNADIDFMISEVDMETLKNIEQINDYGASGSLPVFGGKLSLKSVFQMLKQNRNLY